MGFAALNPSYRVTTGLLQGYYRVTTGLLRGYRGESPEWNYALARAAEPSLLAGLLVDAQGQRLTPLQAVKKIADAIVINAPDTEMHS